MGFSVDVIDSGTDTTGFLDAHRANHPNALLVGSVAHMVVQVLGHIGPQKISRLRMFGHGRGGMQQLGCGNWFNVEERIVKAIYVSDHGQLIPRDYLALLAGRFEPNALVQLHGCKVARRGTGASCCCPTCGRFTSRPPSGTSTPMQTITTRARSLSRRMALHCRSKSPGKIPTPTLSK